MALRNYRSEEENTLAARQRTCLLEPSDHDVAYGGDAEQDEAQDDQKVYQGGGGEAALGDGCPISDKPHHCRYLYEGPEDDEAKPEEGETGRGGRPVRDGVQETGCEVEQNSSADHIDPGSHPREQGALVGEVLARERLSSRYVVLLHCSYEKTVYTINAAARIRLPATTTM